ncbi:hypothetical protein FNV43_RR08817 [Rhamnella rubrinervis]|uniref:DUF1985 domain-containing protein n=1 Tax=Rhamnella rubrinervis TaxID=2594499 RepID=A0A8K0H903_9ROSA|nr:hypothetical protein FNV43_RR08817 [Rhamnella rubrinervis]
MEFNFNGKGAIFTWKEFGLITGLKMEHSLDVTPPPSSNRIRNKYFGDIKKIRNCDIRNSFINLKHSKLEDKDNMIKLTLIYFLECDTLGKESQVGINEQHLSMVEDLNYFNQFAWGLEFYNVIIISMHRVLGLRQGKLNESATYSLCGFPLAFQIWGYETISLMGDLYANKVDDSFLRICNWEDKGHTIFFRQVGIDVFGNNQQYHPVHHDTHMHDATEDVAMGDEGGALDLNMNVVDDDNEVQYVTP